MPRSSSKSSAPMIDRDALVAQLVEAALAQLDGKTAPKSTAKPKATPKAKTQDYDLSKSATRSQVFRAFFAMAKAHHGLTFKADEWPTSGDIQDILDALS